MARSRSEENRLLNKDEQELAAQARHPALAELSDSDLTSLIGRLRERRNRARDVAARQRREMRGKAPSGAQPAADDTGSRAKRDVLSSALKRANKEKDRRSSGQVDMAETGRRALAMKRAAQKKEARSRPQSQSADKGMQNLPNDKHAESGALTQEGHRPVLERSRKVR
jgi:hypothetical protein